MTDPLTFDVSSGPSNLSIVFSSTMEFIDRVDALVKKMLIQGGTVRIAVPDFNSICKIYMDGILPLYPKLLGRLCGEQEYPENLHKCVFDRKFLEFCLSYCGFEQIQNWDPVKEGFEKDSSFDQLEGVGTSLNVTAVAGRGKKGKSILGKILKGRA